MKALILGGVKSGKSRHAERMAADSGKQVIYLATAQPGDEEMRQRITVHQAQRPSHWLTIESPLHLADALRTHDSPRHCLLVDCLTLWLTQLLCQNNEAQLQQEISQLLTLIPLLQGDILLVSNETNLGITPIDALSRRFCDLSGSLHQQLAPHMDKVILTVAGLPLYVKGTPHALDNLPFSLSEY